VLNVSKIILIKNGNVTTDIDLINQYLGYSYSFKKEVKI